MLDGMQLTEQATKNGWKMGVLGGDAQAETFKASMILSSGFKALVSPAFGWPVYAPPK